MRSLDQRITSLEEWKAAREQPDALMSFDYTGEDGRRRVEALVRGEVLSREAFLARYPADCWPAHCLVGVDPNRI